MSGKRKGAPVIAPASDQKSKLNNIDDNEKTVSSQPASSGYARTVISNRYAALADLTEKISRVGRHYFVGSLGGAALVMMRNDEVSDEDAHWTLFVSKARTKRGQGGIAETGSADGRDSGSAA
jgi:hypothetical protein